MTSQGLQLVTVSVASREEIKAVLVAAGKLQSLSSPDFVPRPSSQTDSIEKHKNGKGGRRSGKKGAYNRRA